MKDGRTYAPRLPRSLKEAVDYLRREDGMTFNQFVTVAVAERVSAVETARYFANRKARADFIAFKQNPAPPSRDRTTPR